MSTSSQSVSNALNTRKHGSLTRFLRWYLLPRMHPFRMRRRGQSGGSPCFGLCRKGARNAAHKLLYFAKSHATISDKKRRTNTCKTLRGLCKVGQFCELHFVPHRCCSRGTPQIPNGLPPVLRRWGKMEALVWLDDGKNVPVLAAASKQGSGHIKDGVAGLEVPSPFLCLSAFLVCVVFSFFSARSSLRARARSHLRG